MPEVQDIAALRPSLTDAAFEPDLDTLVFSQTAGTWEHLPQVTFDSKELPDAVDLYPYLHYIRRQGGNGCWGYSALAVWDIMNEMACPFSPNLSMRMWMTLHRHRDLWEKQGGLHSPDGRWHSFKTGPEYGLHQSFGSATEGTEPTLYTSPSWADGGWTVEGTNEAANYRLASLPKSIPVSSTDLKAALAAGRPIRLCLHFPNNAGHFVAVVGYDNSAKEFTYVNSAGDKWGTKGGGRDTYSYADIDAGHRGDMKFAKAEVFEIVPPRPVPVARIAFTHTNRANVALWLGIEGSPHAPSQISPQRWDENSANLRLTVRLPREAVWPPRENSRVFLDVFDTAQYSNSGGTMTEFTVAFGGDQRSSPDVPVKFSPRTRIRLYV